METTILQNYCFLVCVLPNDSLPPEYLQEMNASILDSIGDTTFRLKFDNLVNRYRHCDVVLSLCTPDKKNDSLEKLLQKMPLVKNIWEYDLKSLSFLLIAGEEF